MRSSWISRSHCVNVELSGDNKFLLLPSITDDYFMEKEDDIGDGEMERVMERGSHLINSIQLGRNNSLLGRRNNKGNTFLFSLSADLLSPSLRADLARAPRLYLSTFLSAALKDNTACLEYLQRGGLQFREEQGQCFTALGELAQSSLPHHVYIFYFNVRTH